MGELISRRAAIDAVNGMPDCPNGFSGTYDKAAIIGILEDVPSAQPEHTETHSCDYQRTETHDSCTDCPLYDHDRHNCPRFNKVIPRTIEEVKPRWIPVTEALPDRGKTVLITNDKGNVRSGRFRGVEFWKDDGDAYWTFKGNTVEHVLAWMPLPEPYKEGQDALN